MLRARRRQKRITKKRIRRRTRGFLLSLALSSFLLYSIALVITGMYIEKNKKGAVETDTLSMPAAHEEQRSGKIKKETGTVSEKNNEMLTFFRTLDTKGPASVPLKWKRDKKSETSVSEKPVSPPNSVSFCIQVLASKSRGAAERYKKYLVSKGYNTHITIQDRGKGDILYKVRVGNFSSPKEARTQAKIIAQSEHIEPFIVKISPKKN